MNETDLRDLLPAERRLTAARRRDMEERLMEQITQDVKRGRRRYRLVVGAVAAVLLVVTGVVALMAGDDDPDATGTAQEGEDGGGGGAREGVRWAPIPEEADAAMARWRKYGGGDRPWLPTEQVDCAVPGTTGEDFGIHGGLEQVLGALAGQVPDVPLREPLTRDDIVEPCTRDEFGEMFETDIDRSVLDPAAATPCVVDGEYPSAIVALGGVSCEDASPYADVGLTVRPMTDDDLAMLNRMRAIDIAVMAMPEVCVTRDSAKAWIEAIIAEEGLGISVEPAATDDELVEQGEEMFGADSLDPAGLCFYGMINWGSPLTAAVYALPPDSDADYGPPVDLAR